MEKGEGGEGQKEKINKAMKYLKKFEERLSPEVYRKAAAKLKELGHPAKAGKFSSHAEYILHRQILENIEKMRAIYSKYGTFEISIKSKNVVRQKKFNIALEFDSFVFGEDYGDLKMEMESGGSGPWFVYVNLHGCLIPADDDAADYVTSIMNDYHYKGILNTVLFTITLKIKDGSVSAVGYSSDSMGDLDRFDIEFSDKNSAKKFKKLLIDIFGNPNFDYPAASSGETLFEHIERVVLAESSFSSDYGFSIEDIAEYLKSLSDYKFFREL